MNQTQVPLGMPWRWHRRGVPTAFGRRTTPHPWPCPPPHDDSRPPLPSHAHAHGPAPSCKDADIGAPIEPAGTGPTSGPGCGLRDRAHARARVAGAGQRGVRCGTRLPKGQPSEHPQLRPCLGEPLPWQPDFGSYAVDRIAPDRKRNLFFRGPLAHCAQSLGPMRVSEARSLEPDSCGLKPVSDSRFPIPDSCL